MVAALVALLLAIVLTAEVSSSPAGGPESPLRYAVPETARRLESTTPVRRLLFIPLKNRTGDAELDFLSYGVPAMLFSNMHSAFLVEGAPLLQKRTAPAGLSEGGGRDGKPERDTVPATAGLVYLRAALLEFRTEAVRERQRGLPEGMSRIPVKEKAIQEGEPGQVALENGAHWYVEGSFEFEPVPDPVYVDPRGQRVVLTADVRRQLEGKELPRALAKLLRDLRPSKVLARMSLRSFEKGAEATLWSEEFRLTVAAPYEGVDFAAPARRLEDAIRKENPVVLRLRSVKSPGFAFLNDVFVGKTPVDLRVPVGRMKLRVEQDGCNHFRAETTGVSAEITATCETFRGTALLSVVSEPAGADVYLDHEFLGKTPLRRDDLAPGVHRVRVSAKDHVDGFYGVTLSGSPTEVTALLKKGDTVSYYRDPGYGIQDWTYDDLSFGFLVHSLAGYAGWRYGNIRATRERDSVRGPFLPSYFPLESYGVYQYQQLEQARLRALTWERNGKAMAGVGVASFLAGGYFLYRALAHDERPFGELPETASMPRFYLAPVISGRGSNGQMVGLSMTFAF